MENNSVCCFTMSILTSLLIGFFTGMVTKKIMDNHGRNEKKFPPAPVLATSA